MLRKTMLILGVMLGYAIGSSGSDAAEPFTVMTWNLEWFYDDEPGDSFSKLAREKKSPSREQWNWRRDAFAKGIAQVKPTVVALQEVENRRVLWYLVRAIDRNHSTDYRELAVQSRDHYTEQDVGLLIRAPADAVSFSQRMLQDRLRPGARYYDVSKHLLAVVEFPVGDSFERITVLNVHLRSRAEGEPIRKRQARLVHLWLAEAIKAGENVIVLGDFNTEETGDETRPDSDLGILSGRETPGKDDDLVDLHLRIPMAERQTHLLPGKQFDRIFCSPSLVEDDPAKPDLVFQSIQVRRDLAIQGEPDVPEDHWERYWELAEDQRDLSDHLPVLATFDVR